MPTWLRRSTTQKKKRESKRTRLGERLRGRHVKPMVVEAEIGEETRVAEDKNAAIMRK